MELNTSPLESWKVKKLLLPVVIPVLDELSVFSSKSFFLLGRARLIGSALEGADVFCHYHPSEEQDAKDTAEYIKKVAPNAKVETYAKDLRTEAACLEMVEEVKKWSGGKLDILYVLYLKQSFNGR